MYAFALSCVFFTASQALSEPIPVVHDRLIRHCDNHTSTSYAPYAIPSPVQSSPIATVTIPIVSGAATSIYENTTAGAVGTSATSSGSSGYTDEYASTTSQAAITGSSGSGWGGATSSISNIFSSNTASVSRSSCLGQGCTAFTSMPSSDITPTYTNTSSTLAPGNATTESALIATITINDTLTTLETISITANIVPSGPCYGYGCSATYTNSTMNSSSLESTAAGAVGTANASATPADTTIFMNTATATATSSPYYTNSSSLTSSPPSNISYLGTSSTAAATTAASSITPTPTAAITPSSTNASAVNQTSPSASASGLGQINGTLSSIWADWTKTAHSSVTLPTTLATSLSSVSVTGPSPTGALNATTSLPEIEAELVELAGDSVSLIEEINSLIASLGGKKRRAGKRHV